MKKKAMLLILSVASMGLLAACGEEDGKDTSSASADVSSVEPSSSEEDSYFVKEKTEITFWHTSSYDSTIDKIIEGFQKIEPNVTVTASKYSGSYDDLREQIIQGIPANNYPDIFLGYPDSVQEIMEYNKVVKLDDYINNEDYGWTDDDLEDILPAYLEEGQLYPISGTWSVPAAKSTEAMYYTKDLIGLNLSTYDSSINGGNPLDTNYLNNLTWEELFNKLCPAIIKYNDSLDDDHKLYKTDYDYHGIVGYDSDANFFITLAQQYGYGYTSIDETTGEGSVDFVNDGMKSLMKTMNAAASNGYLITQGTAGSYTNYAFTAKNALFSIGSTGGSKYQIDDANKFETGVARIPHAEGGESMVINQGPSVAVLNHDDDNRALASWLFCRYFSNEENSLYWALNTGYSPVRYSSYTSAEYLEYANSTGKEDYSLEKLQAEVANYVSDVSSTYYNTPVFRGSSTARTEAESIVTQVLMTSAADLTDAKLDEIFDTAKNNVLKDM